MSKDRKNCLCTAMLYDPKDHYTPAESAASFQENKKGYERLIRFKRYWLTKFLKKKDNDKNKSLLSYFFNL